MPLSEVVLDASVLYPDILCDTLLRAAEAGLYRPRWSDDILRELLDNLPSRIGRARAERRVALMRLSFPTAAVAGDHDLSAGMQNHPDDRHVLAAAVTAHADTIVTSNLRHFPHAALAPQGVRAVAAGDFLIELLERDAKRMVRVLEQQAAYVKPPMTVAEVLARLAELAPTLPARYREHRR